MPDARRVGQLLGEVRAALRHAGLAFADLDSRLLVADTLGLDAAGLILRAGDAVSAADAEIVAGRLSARLRGVPVHRILGRRSFYDHEFHLSPDTLEPRPDTEVLVELAAEAFRDGTVEGQRITFADVGTGSGAIAVSLLALFPLSLCVAIDLSEGALLTALGNADKAGVGARFLPLRSDYLASLKLPLDAVVSNPPYIPSADISDLDIGVRDHDPHLALDGGADGLDAYRRIVRESAALLVPGGDLLLEIGAGQAPAVMALAEAAGFVTRQTRKDLGGITRALWFRRDNPRFLGDDIS